VNIYLDMDVACDHQKKLYQIQLYTTLRLGAEDVDELTSNLTLDGVPLSALEYSAVLDFRRFAETMNYVRQLIVNGYAPVGKGTDYPQMVLPSKAQNALREWV